MKLQPRDDVNIRFHREHPVVIHTNSQWNYQAFDIPFCAYTFIAFPSTLGLLFQKTVALYIWQV